MDEETPADTAQGDLVTCAAEITAFKAGDAARSVDVVASTDAIDSMGEIVEQSWDLKRFKANPVVLWAHASREPPIGKASAVAVRDGKLQCRITFASEKANPRAEQAWNLIQEGMLGAVSVGFRPRSVRKERRDDREVYVLADNELYELSVTPVPANAEALMRLRTRAALAAPAAALAVQSDRGADAASPFEARMSDNKKAGVELVTAAARMGIAAHDEDDATSAIVARAESLGDVCKALKLPATATARDAIEAVSTLAAKSAELATAQTELDELRAEKADRETVERKAHVDAVIAAKPALADAREALEAFAKADYVKFAAKHPKPTAPAREKALTSVVVPHGGNPRQPSVNEAPVAEKAPGQLHSDAAAALADALIAKHPEKYAGVDGYIAALTEVSRSLKAGA